MKISICDTQIFTFLSLHQRVHLATAQGFTASSKLRGNGMRLRAAVSALSYMPSKVDPAVFVRRGPNGTAILFTHVDDTAGTGPSGRD
jgi:hypothetical protein